MIRINSKYISRVILLVLTLLLAASLLWTGWRWQPVSSSQNLAQAQLSLTPGYEVIANRATSLWPAGTLLDPASAAFSYAVMPQIRLMPAVQVNPLPQGQLAGVLNMTLTLQAVNDTGKTYWSMPLPNAPEQTFTLQADAGRSSPGQPAVYIAQPVVIDAAANYSRAEQVGKELGFENAKLQLIAQITATVNGQLDNHPVAQSLSTDLQIELNQISFTMPSVAENTASLTLSAEPGTASGARPALLNLAIATIQNNSLSLAIDVLLLAILLAFVLSRKSWHRRTGKSIIDHRRFREWITEGSVQVHDKTPILVNQLEGLVDLAIDSDKRVIFDVVQKKYFVLDEQIVYCFDPLRAPNLAKKRLQLGKYLAGQGLISSEQLETALFYHQRTGFPLGESLMALGFISESTLFKALAELENLVYADVFPEDVHVDEEALAQLTPTQAQVLMAVPVGRDAEGRIIVICSKTGREGVQQLLEEVFKTGVVLQIARPSVIRKVLESLDS